MKFFKLYTPPSGRSPRPKIDVYYHGIPLILSAVFEQDRYSFKLPLNLCEKMITGNLYADLCYTVPESRSGRDLVPVSMVLSDRYD